MNTVISSEVISIVKECRQEVQKLESEKWKGAVSSLHLGLQKGNLSEEETRHRVQSLTKAVGIAQTSVEESVESQLRAVQDVIANEVHIQQAINNFRANLDLQCEQNQYSTVFPQDMRAAIASQHVAHKLVEIARSNSYEYIARIVALIMSPIGLGGDALCDALFCMREYNAGACVYAAIVEDCILKGEKCLVCQDSDCLSKDHLFKTASIIRTSLLNDKGILPATVFTETYPSFEFLIDLSTNSEWIALLKDLLMLLTLLPINSEKRLEYSSREERFIVASFIKQKREGFLDMVLNSKENKRPLSYKAANGVAFALFWLTYLRHRDSCYSFQESMYTDRKHFEDLISYSSGRSLLVPTRKVCLSVLLPKSLRPDDDRAWQGAFLWEEADPLNKGVVFFSCAYNFAHIFVVGDLNFNLQFWLYCLTKAFSYDKEGYMLTGDPSKFQNLIPYEWFEKKVGQYLTVMSDEELYYNDDAYVSSENIFTVPRRSSDQPLNLMYSFKETVKLMYDQCISALQLPFWNLKSLEESEDIPLEQQRKNKMAIMVSEQYMRYFTLSAILEPSMLCDDEKVISPLSWVVANRLSGKQNYFKGFGQILASMPFGEAALFVNLSKETPLESMQRGHFEIAKDLYEEFEELGKCVSPIFQEFILDDLIENIYNEECSLDIVWTIVRNHSLNLKVENQRLPSLSRPTRHNLRYLVFKKALPKSIPQDLFMLDQDPCSEKEEGEILSARFKQYLLPFLYTSADEETTELSSVWEENSKHIEEYFKLKDFYEHRV